MKRLLSIAVGSAMAFGAQAYDRIPQTAGLAGYVFLGASSNSMESNTLATVGGTEVSDERIDSVSDSPDSKSYGRVTPAFNLSYTLDGSRTQFFGGTELDDFLTQDSSLGLGVRQSIGSLGNLRASLLASTEREVYKDPYVVGVDRSKTDQTSKGMRLGWEHILESDFELTYTHRKIDIDKELSGSTAPLNGGLGLTAEQINDLDRNGDFNKIDFSYVAQLSPYSLFTSTYSYVEYDLDGDAMSMSGPMMQLDYGYTGLQDWQLNASVVLATMSSDDYNPVYGEKQDQDSYGVSLTAAYLEPFGLKDWKALGTFAYGQQDNQIDFYDTSISSVNLGMMYSF
ncbi:DUF2860 family protein [Pseudomonas sp. N040]|uniref:DUF2860 family protein n=1 Tax=Pseudomonas sp. N040 TaxID=2785325 RepID=UPI0018A293CE|nr:DUF2860 family protein [Pseudomonas sp. N040]MBF7730092.1 DUF2860 family protein [Pseudomonas sp. N040]MBW7013734.1 DUF2860 domain-containing protein [Pseudomonas sp. N040]